MTVSSGIAWSLLANVLVVVTSALILPIVFPLTLPLSSTSATSFCNSRYFNLGDTVGWSLVATALAAPSSDSSPTWRFTVSVFIFGIRISPQPIVSSGFSLTNSGNSAVLSRVLSKSEFFDFNISESFAFNVSFVSPSGIVTFTHWPASFIKLFNSYLPFSSVVELWIKVLAGINLLLIVISWFGEYSSSLTPSAFVSPSSNSPFSFLSHHTSDEATA